MPADAPAAEAAAAAAAAAAGACRICLEGEEEGALVSPCPCRGSIRFVHERCLWRWLRTRDPALGFQKVRPAKRRADFRRLPSDPDGDGAADDAPHLDARRRGAGGHRCEVCRAPYRLLVSPLPWGAFVRVCARRLAAFWRRRGARGVAARLAAAMPAHPAPFFRYAFHAAYFWFLLRKLRQLGRRAGVARLVLLAVRGRAAAAAAAAGARPRDGVVLAPRLVLLLVFVMLSHHASVLYLDAAAAARAVQAYRAQWCRFRILGRDDGADDVARAEQ